jgi:hypothetical protein
MTLHGGEFRRLFDPAGDKQYAGGFAAQRRYLRPQGNGYGDRPAIVA